MVRNIKIKKHKFCSWYRNHKWLKYIKVKLCYIIVNESKFSKNKRTLSLFILFVAQFTSMFKIIKSDLFLLCK